jgi:hypothetical protein
LKRLGHDPRQPGWIIREVEVVSPADARFMSALKDFEVLFAKHGLRHAADGAFLGDAFQLGRAGCRPESGWNSRRDLQQLEAI